MIEKTAEEHKVRKRTRETKAGRKKIANPVTATEPDDDEELAEFIDVCTTSVLLTCDPH